MLNMTSNSLYSTWNAHISVPQANNYTAGAKGYERPFRTTPEYMASYSSNFMYEFVDGIGCKDLRIVSVIDRIYTYFFAISERG